MLLDDKLAAVLNYDRSSLYPVNFELVGPRCDPCGMLL